MQNSDRPVGQRFGHGAFLGAPPGTRLFTKASPFFGHVFDPTGCRRAWPHSSVIGKLINFGWLDKDSQPHGRSGDKLARKAANGMVGQRSMRGY